MKTLVYLLLVLLFHASGRAQTVQYCVFATTNGQPTSITVQTNQLITVLSNIGSLSGHSVAGTQLAMAVGLSYYGLTNLSYPVGGGGYATLQLTTPPPAANVISNYLPADCIVIPASVSGANIIMESSPDLVNWTAAMPGYYGSGAGSNRFFRLRALAQ